MTIESLQYCLHKHWLSLTKINIKRNINNLNVRLGLIDRSESWRLLTNLPNSVKVNKIVSHPTSTSPHLLLHRCPLFFLSFCSRTATGNHLSLFWAQSLSVSVVRRDAGLNLGFSKRNILQNCCLRTPSFPTYSAFCYFFPSNSIVSWELGEKNIPATSLSTTIR